MSSLIGHSIAGITVFSLKNQFSSSLMKRLWLLWLIFLASFHDLDKFIPVFGLGAKPQISITHSIFVSLLLGLGTTLFLALFGFKGRVLALLSWQASLASLSHLVLDLLVGVYPKPLLWPFSAIGFRLPFGVLPSAAKFNLFNYFFYRNSLIEMGVLIPLSCIAYLMTKNRTAQRHQSQKIAGLLVISISFMAWAFNLSR